MAKANNYFWKVIVYFPDNTNTSALVDNCEKYVAHVAQTRPDWTHANVYDELYNCKLREIQNDSKKSGNS